MFTQYASRRGLPRGLYVDQHSIYRADREPTSDDILADHSPETQFGRAMRELEVELILARSPQATGRVERMNGTLQDRLVKALRRANISALEAANQFLDEVFLPELNAPRVGCVARAVTSAFAPRDARGSQRLDGSLAEPVVAVASRDIRSGRAAASGDVVRTARWQVACVCRRGGVALVVGASEGRSVAAAATSSQPDRFEPRP